MKQDNNKIQKYLDWNLKPFSKYIIAKKDDDTTLGGYKFITIIPYVAITILSLFSLITVFLATSSEDIKIESFKLVSLYDNNADSTSTADKIAILKNNKTGKTISIATNENTIKNKNNVTVYHDTDKKAYRLYNFETVSKFSKSIFVKVLLSVMFLYGLSMLYAFIKI